MINWYNLIAGVYDIFTTQFYKKMRQDLIKKLNLEEGNRILIIACGTGQSFNLIERKIGKQGEIIAIDNASSMLSKAQKRIQKHHWENIKLIKADVRELSPEFLNRKGIKTDFDIILGELAFSVIPDWKKVMKTSVILLNKTGKLGILDWYRPHKDLLTRIVNGLAQANTNRNTPEYAAQLTKHFEIIKTYFFKSVYIATGDKK